MNANVSFYVSLLHNARDNITCIYGSSLSVCLFIYFIYKGCGEVQRNSNGAFLFSGSLPSSNTTCEWIVGSQRTVELIVIMDRLVLRRGWYVSLCKRRQFILAFVVVIYKKCATLSLARRFITLFSVAFHSCLRRLAKQNPGITFF